MSPDEIRSLVRKVFEISEQAQNSQNSRAVMDSIADYYKNYISPEFVWHHPPFSQDFDVQESRKVDESQTFSNSKSTIHEILVDGQTAVVRYSFEAIHANSSAMLPIPATGRKVGTMACAILRFQDGKLVEQWDFLDYLEIMKQLGVEKIPA